MLKIYFTIFVDLCMYVPTHFGEGKLKRERDVTSHSQHLEKESPAGSLVRSVFALRAKLVQRTDRRARLFPLPCAPFSSAFFRFAPHFDTTMRATPSRTHFFALVPLVPPAREKRVTHNPRYVNSNVSGLSSFKRRWEQ